MIRARAGVFVCVCECVCACASVCVGARARAPVVASTCMRVFLQVTLAGSVRGNFTHGKLLTRNDIAESECTARIQEARNEARKEA